MLSLKIKQTRLFEKLVKKLSKKYRNIENDIDAFLNSIETKKDLGISLGNNIYKIRIRNSDNDKGKSSGYRLISYLQLIDAELVLVYIYSKNDIANISEKELDKIVINLLK